MNASPPTADDGAWPKNRWIALAVLLLAGFMNLIDVTIVNVSLPSMQRAFNASSSAIEWVVAAYILAFALGLLPFGRLGDTFGRRNMFLGGIVCFTLFSTLCGLAPNIEILVAARAAQGLSAAMMAPQTLAIAQVIFPPAERGAAFALFGLAASFAAVTGPLAGGLLIGANIFGLDWRPIFLVNIPVGLFAIVMTLWVVPSMRGEKALGVDIVGILLASAAVFLVVFPLVEGRGYGWPAWCFVLLAAAAPFAIAFILWERSRAAAGQPQLLPASLLANREFMLGTLTASVFFSGVPGFFMTLAIFLQSGFGYTPLQSGLTTMPFSIGVLLSSLLSHRLAGRWLKPRVLVGAALMVAGMAGLQFVVSRIDGDLNPYSLLPFLLAAGFGMGTTIAPLFQMVLSSVQGRDAGSAAGGVQSFQQVGGAFGVAIVGQMFFSRLTSGMAASAGNIHSVFVGAMESALFYEIAAFSVVALAATLLRPPVTPAHRHAPMGESLSA